MVDRTKLEKKRVTVPMQPDLYEEFHVFAQDRSLSDGRAASILINACFRGTVYALLTIQKPKGEKEHG